MATNRPDPGEFLEFAQRMLRELFGNQRDDDDEPWADATRSGRESWAGERTYGSGQRNREPSAEERRENLTFALATRAVEALEDLALNVAAIRQRLERTGAATEGRGPEEGAADKGHAEEHGADNGKAEDGKAEDGKAEDGDAPEQ
jgi:hypothetical protein